MMKLYCCTGYKKAHLSEVEAEENSLTYVVHIDGMLIHIRKFQLGHFVKTRIGEVCIATTPQEAVKEYIAAHKRQLARLQVEIQRIEQNIKSGEGVLEECL